jgi:hypothetical protein
MFDEVISGPSGAGSARSCQKRGLSKLVLKTGLENWSCKKLVLPKIILYLK